MDTPKNILGSFEEIVLLATHKLGEGAYGAKIRQAVEEALGKSVSIGAIYATLDRLERKGFISSRQGEATPERGGRAKRYFRIQGDGLAALSDTWAARRKLTEGVDTTWDPLGGTI